MTIYVITWETGKHTGIVGVYGKQREAEVILQILADYGDLEKKFKLTATEVELSE